MSDTILDDRLEADAAAHKPAADPSRQLLADTVLERELASPPREFSVLPFWFWNDDLSEAEIVRQIADFDAHGVFGFVIHPRVGLPRSIGWMSDALIGYMHVAIREAARRQMKVILYDEGMYPSGSSCGQVVEADASLACRALAMVEQPAGEPVVLPADANRLGTYPLADGRVMVVFDKPAESRIRGLHYIGEGPDEDEPPMGDILNPRTVQTVLRLVHDRFYAEFGDYFGSTVIGIFTDEPSPLGRTVDRTLRPGTRDILPHVNRLLGYDIAPHLPALWREDVPDAQRYRRDYHWAIQRRLEETWYAPLSEWCQRHGIALCGHPAEGDEIGTLRHFHIPGQDLVWRWVAPDMPSALEGSESTQAKASSSAMIHAGQQRNSNEFCGAYGPQTTFDEFCWLAWWCLVRGVNLLIPHAFYYSVRGPRRDERPPQVGPHSPWWDSFGDFADASRRLCWLNTDSHHVCHVAILTGPDHCPWQAAKACFQQQVDFNYLEVGLLDKATLSPDGIRLGAMHYHWLIVDDESILLPEVERKLSVLQSAGRVLRTDAQLAHRLARLPDADVHVVRPSPSLRYRHVIKHGNHFYLFFNEENGAIDTPLRVAAHGQAMWIDPATGHGTPAERPLHLALPSHGITLLRIIPESD